MTFKLNYLLIVYLYANGRRRKAGPPEPKNLPERRTEDIFLSPLSGCHQQRSSLSFSRGGHSCRCCHCCCCSHNKIWPNEEHGIRGTYGRTVMLFCIVKRRGEVTPDIASLFPSLSLPSPSTTEKEREDGDCKKLLLSLM